MSEEAIASGLKLQYALLADPHTGQEFNLCRFATSVGRSISSDIVLTDKSVSRQHAIVYCLKGRFYLEDVGSTNGTIVNGQRIDGRVEIRAGDEIRVGTRHLIFMLIPDRNSIGTVSIVEDPTVPTAEEIAFSCTRRG